MGQTVKIYFMLFTIFIILDVIQNIAYLLGGSTRYKCRNVFVILCPKTNVNNVNNTGKKEISFISPDIYFNSLWPSDAIWRQRSGSTLAQVMACCLTEPSHYLNQCWLIISKVYWHSSEGNLTAGISAINHCNWLEKYSSKISSKSPRPQWVKNDYIMTMIERGGVLSCLLDFLWLPGLSAYDWA